MGNAAGGEHAQSHGLRVFVFDGAQFAYRDPRDVINILYNDPTTWSERAHELGEYIVSLGQMLKYKSGMHEVIVAYFE